MLWPTLYYHKYFQSNFYRLKNHNVCLSYIQADRSSKTSKEGSLHENEYNTCWSISIFIANRQVNTSWSWLPVRSKHPLLPHQYVINAPVIISAGDIKRIAEVVKKAIQDSINDEISNTIDEKIYHYETTSTTTSRKNESSLRFRRARAVWMTLTYKAIWHRWNLFRRYRGQNTGSKSRNLTFPIQIIKLQRVVNLRRQKARPRKIISRLNSVKTNIRFLRSSKLFQNTSKPRRIR